jgi:hypothetical protein
VNPNVTVVSLTDEQVARRRDRLTDFLDVWGDLRVLDAGADLERRLLEFALESPGEALPTEIKVRYREYYRRGRPRMWNFVKYHYEYLDLRRSRRLAYHLHDIGSRPLVPHAHCEPAEDLEDSESPHHLRAVELDLQEAHRQFMRLWASDTAPDCAVFLPLEVTRVV